VITSKIKRAYAIFVRFSFMENMNMSGTVVALVSGEALANGHGPTIFDQKLNTKDLADGLAPLLTPKIKLAVLHGNKPQVGFVLFRSEVASHALHTVPLDVCGADTQGATGYMISQALRNTLGQQQIDRRVVCVLTQTLVESGNLDQAPLKAIGPWFDRDKAEQYRLARRWKIVEEPGRGYRRGVPSLPPLEIFEMAEIKSLVETGSIVVAAGGGGIPVVRNSQGMIEGIEAVVDTEQVARMVAQSVQANVLLMIVDRDDKFIRSGLVMDRLNMISLDKLDEILREETIQSGTVQSALRSASDFLHGGGEQVMISSLANLPKNLANRRGLRIGSTRPSVSLFEV
jgi:carbamate kinase